MLQKRTNRRVNTEGSQRTEKKDKKKEMSGKLKKTKDMKGNNITQMGGKKEETETEEIYTGNPSCQKLLLIKLRQGTLPEELNQAWKVQIT